MDKRRSGLALLALCLGILMTVLDTTVVTIALPSIVRDLNIASTSLTWMLNAYTISYGGCLLLSGRLSDLYGPRRLFLTGVVVFTIASLACGFSHTQAILLTARAIQGLGGAAVTSVGLSLIANLFPDPTQRARAMGVYGFVCSAGGAVGQLLGGLLSEFVSWHWIFLVNLPIGVAVYVCCIMLLPPDGIQLDATRKLDITGALTITLASTLGVYAIANGNAIGWLAMQTTGLFVAAGSLLLLYIINESRTSQPLMPARLFRRNFIMANVVGVLSSAGALAWFVISTFYLQHILRYNPLDAGLAFAPATVIVAMFSGGLSAVVFTWFGIRTPLSLGLLLSAVGLALFARAPQNGTFIMDVLPPMILLGLGGGMTSTPFLLAAMKDVDPRDSGVASGVLNTSLLMGGAIGLAVLASLADIRTGALRQSGMEAAAALNDGYHLAFAMGALFNATAAVISAIMFHHTSQSTKIDQAVTGDLP